MRVAVLHWYTSSVGGIATTFANYKAVAGRRGDTFHVLASDNQKTKRVNVFPAPQRVRGGDSFIDIDGHAPHHISNAGSSAHFLNKNYDVIVLSTLCPHPTKHYGSDPVFMELLKQIKLPIIGYIHDAYWDTYKEFGELVIPLCEEVYVCQDAYGKQLLAHGFKVKIAYPPFDPIPVKKAEKVPNRVVWLPQWKNIKGVHQFFRGITRLAKFGLDLRMYNNGIEYYKLRLTEDWKKTVGRDHFAESYSGKGKAQFFGSRSLPEVMQALSEASFSVDFQGHKSKFEAYKSGSYNHTLAESMYYGACPVVHSNLLKSGVPRDLVLPVDDLDTYPAVIAEYRASTKYPAKRAREFVLDRFSAEKQYDKIFGKFRRGRK